MRIDLPLPIIYRYCNCPARRSNNVYDLHSDSCAIFTFIIDAQAYGQRQILTDDPPAGRSDIQIPADALSSTELDAAAIKILSASDPEPEEAQDDVEAAPVVNVEEVHDWLPMNEMVTGRVYRLAGELLTLGWWDGTSFVGLRQSGQLMSEGHISDEGTAKPLDVIENTTFSATMDQNTQKEALRTLARIHGCPTL